MSTGFWELSVKCPYCGYENKVYDGYESDDDGWSEVFFFSGNPSPNVLLNPTGKKEGFYCCPQCQETVNIDDLFRNKAVKYDYDDLNQIRNYLVNNYGDAIRHGGIRDHYWEPDLDAVTRRFCDLFPDDAGFHTIRELYDMGFKWSTPKPKTVHFRGGPWAFLKSITSTSVSIGPFSVSADLTHDRDVARRLLFFLEDRRVLYIAQEFESPKACIDSIMEIRKMITNELPHTEDNCFLQNEMLQMRAICVAFLSANEGKFDTYGYFPENRELSEDDVLFISGLVSLRTFFALSLKKISKKYKLNLSSNLERMICNLTDVDE